MKGDAFDEVKGRGERKPSGNGVTRGEPRWGVLDVCHGGERDSIWESCILLRNDP